MWLERKFLKDNNPFKLLWIMLWKPWLISGGFDTNCRLHKGNFTGVVSTWNDFRGIIKVIQTVKPSDSKSTSLLIPPPTKKKLM